MHNDSFLQLICYDYVYEDVREARRYRKSVKKVCYSNGHCHDTIYVYNIFILVII